MASTMTWTAKRQKIQLQHQALRNHSDHLLEEHSQAIEVAQAHCPDEFRETLGQLTNISERVSSHASTCISSLVNVEKSYGDLVAELQREKEQDQFAARHRDYVSKFDDRAFVYLVRHEPKWRALAAGAQQVTNKSDLLKVLKAMKSAEEDGDEDAAAVHLTPHNLQLREAWYEAVKAKGLSLQEYQALRI